MRPLPDDNPAVSLYLTRSEFSKVVMRANTNAEGLHFSGQLPTRQVANSVEDSKPRGAGRRRPRNGARRALTPGVP
jgi:hypothetical protein